MNFLTFTTNVFNQILEISFQASVLVALVLLVQLILGRQLTPAWRHGLWILVLIRLLIPVIPTSPLSIHQHFQNGAKFTVNDFGPYSEDKAAEFYRVVEKNQEQRPSLPESTPPEDLSEIALLTPVENEITVTMASNNSNAKDEVVSEVSTQVRIDQTTHDAALDNATRPRSLSLSLRMAVACIWFGVTILMFGLRLIEYQRYRRILKSMTTVDDHSTLKLLEEIKSLVKVNLPIGVFESSQISSPAIAGLMKPRILFPKGLIGRYTEEEVRHIFLHELAHWKRGDLHLNALFTTLMNIHWFNPVLWFAWHRMRVDRETATDGLALEYGGDVAGKAYSQTLVKLLDDASQSNTIPGMVGILESNHQIKDRIRQVLRFRKSTSWSMLGLIPVLGLAAIALTGADIKKGAEPNFGPDSVISGTPVVADIKQAKGNNSDVEFIADTEMRQFGFYTKILDEDKALEGVKIAVEVIRYGGIVELDELVTNAEGRAVLEFDPVNAKELSYTLEKEGYLTLIGSWKKQQIDDLPEVLDVGMSPGVRIGGRVVNEDGKPIRGATIVANETHLYLIQRRPAYSIMYEALSDQYVASTDRNGRWEADFVWPGFSNVDLRIKHPDFADVIYSTEVTEAMEEIGHEKRLVFDQLSSLSAQFVLNKGFHVSGAVMDSKGKPVPDAQIKVFDRESNSVRDQAKPAAIAATGAGGNFAFDHLPATILRFAVIADGYAPYMHEMDLVEDVDKLFFKVNQGKPLKIRIVDNDGNPVPGVNVTGADWSIWQGFDWADVTDENGIVRLPNAPETAFRAKLEKDGFIPTAKVFSGGEDRTVQLSQALHLYGEVVDAETQLPVENFDIRFAAHSNYLNTSSEFSAEGQNGQFQLDLSKLHAESISPPYFYSLVIRITAEGYEPLLSREFSWRKGDVGRMEHAFELERAEVFSGIVQDQEGNIVPEAETTLILPNTNVRLLPGKTKLADPDRYIIDKTDSEGRFQLSFEPEAKSVVAVHDLGIGYISIQDLNETGVVTLRPWARVEGQAWFYDEKLAGDQISMGLHLSDFSFAIGYPRTQSDENGNFVFENVPPGKVRIYANGPAETYYIEPGITRSVKFGGIGRPVTGKIKVMNPYVKMDWSSHLNHLSASTVLPGPPEKFETDEDLQRWMSLPEVVKAYDERRNHRMNFNSDGTFRIEEVIPGKYSISIVIYDPRESDAFAHGKTIAKFYSNFEIPESEDQNSAKPYDIGEFELWLEPNIKDGETEAPELSAKGIHNADFELSDLSGKYVVLDFWATWCAPCIAELPYLRKVHEEFGGRDDFALVSLSLDESIDKPTDFISKNNMPWLQGYLGDLRESKTAKDYGFTGIPAVFLISPDGKMLATELRGQTLYETVKQYLHREAK